MCRVLRVSPSGYYAWLERPVSPRARRREHLAKKVQQIFTNSRQTYGSPRVHRQLLQEGQRPSVNTVAKIMREQGLKAKGFKRYKPRTTDSKHGLAVVEDRLQRRFTASAANRVWVADITYIPTRQGWLYLAVVLDVYSRMVVGWSMADHLRAELVCEALRMAVARRGPGPGLIHHSDRGVQYASGQFQDLLGACAMMASMSGRGDCYDNAMMESFRGSLKVELVHGEDWLDHEQARQQVFESIEVFYNRVRLHSSLGYLSPLAFESQAA